MSRSTSLCQTTRQSIAARSVAASRAGLFPPAGILSAASRNMLHRRAFAATLLALFSLSVVDVAEAAVSNDAGGVLALVKSTAPVENAQYYSFDGDNYCWYDSGWQGPGWYWCGYEWDEGLGWGGPYGWNGWGRYQVWRHLSHRVGTWHSGPPNYGGVGGLRSTVGPGGNPVHHRSGSGVAVLPAFRAGAAPSFHNFGAPGAALPRLSTGSTPDFHSFGGGTGFHGSGGNVGGFHGIGGGGSWPSGGHGGHGR